MDLRVKKTEKSIQNAFLKLRASKPIEKISIKELCESAMINKATFYLHYRDIYELAETMENDMIEHCLSMLPDSETTCVERVVPGLIRIFLKQREHCAVLFSGSRMDSAIRRIDAFIKERLYQRSPQLKQDLAFNIRLTATTYGCFYAFFTYKEYSTDAVLAHLTRFSQRCLG